MSEKVLNTANLFPSFEKLSAFLQQESHRPVSLPDPTDRLQKRFTATFITTAGVLNAVTYFNTESLYSVAWKPQFITQNYHDKPSGATTKIFLNDIFLESGLTIPVRSGQIDETSISSKALYLGRKWTHTQLVFMLLNFDYLNKLKSEGLIPIDALRRLWVESKDGTIKAAIDRQDQGLYYLANDDQLRRICVESGLDYDIDLPNGQTTGRIGRISFNLRHVSPNSLDPDMIWRALTGTKPDNPYIFPVVVS